MAKSTGVWGRQVDARGLDHEKGGPIMLCGRVLWENQRSDFVKRLSLRRTRDLRGLLGRLILWPHVN